jgi:hypothetical protein
MGIGGSYQQSTTRAKDLTPDEFKELRQPIADLFRNAFPDIGKFLGGNLPFEAPENLDAYRAPLSLGEQRSLTDLNELGESRESSTDVLSRDLLDRTIAGDFLKPEDNPNLRNIISLTNRAINDSFNDQGLEQQGLFARAGHQLNESSPFAQAQGALNADRLNAIADATAQLAFGVGEAERGRQMEALELNRGETRANAEAEFNRQLNLLAANALPRLIDEIGFDRAFVEYQSRINALSQALGLAAGVTPATAVTESQSSGGSGSFQGAG